MDVSVNYVAVLLAGLSAVIVGFIWYSPKIWYEPWLRLSKAVPKKETTTSSLILRYGSVLLASLVTAYVLAYVSFVVNHFFRNSFVLDTVLSAFWLWVGFTLSRIYVHDRFENRPWRLSMINAGYELATVLIMAIIIGSMRY
jgi:hypothetical protein